MKLARFQISADLLREMLHLPKDTSIVDVRAIFFCGRNDAEITVKSEQFADVLDGETPPVKTPWFENVDGEPRFLEWR